MSAAKISRTCFSCPGLTLRKMLSSLTVPRAARRPLRGDAMGRAGSRCVVVGSGWVVMMDPPVLYVISASTVGRRYGYAWSGSGAHALAVALEGVGMAREPLEVGNHDRSGPGRVAGD